VQVPEGAALKERFDAVEERIEEAVKPGRLAMRFRHCAPHPEGTLGSH
jgi:hypothetical protein